MLRIFISTSMCIYMKQIKKGGCLAIADLHCTVFCLIDGIPGLPPKYIAAIVWVTQNMQLYWCKQNEPAGRTCWVVTTACVRSVDNDKNIGEGEEGTM